MNSSFNSTDFGKARLISFNLTSVFIFPDKYEVALVVRYSWVARNCNAMTQPNTKVKLIPAIQAAINKIILRIFFARGLRPVFKAGFEIDGWFLCPGSS